MNAVFWVASFFPRPTGATHSATRLARELRSRGVSITFFVDAANGRRDGESWEGFPVRVFFMSGSGKARKFLSLLKMAWLLRSGRVRCDILHVHGGGHMNLILAGLLQRVAGCRALMKITLDGWDTPDGLAREKWARWVLGAFHRLDAVVAMTSGQAEKCVRSGYRGLLKTIPNGVDAARYRPPTEEERVRLRESLGLGKDDVALIYVGWLGRRKGTDLLLRIFARLRPRHPGLKLMLVGDYLDGRELHDRELFPGLADRPADAGHGFDSGGILVTGHVGNVEAYLRAADIFVFPSRQEGFGTVQIEAMACGLPCVVNDLPGVSVDIYPDETAGIRIAGEEPGHWVAVLEKLVNDPSLRVQMGQRARERAEKHFSLEHVGREYMELYRELCPEKVGEAGGKAEMRKR